MSFDQLQKTVVAGNLCTTVFLFEDDPMQRSMVVSLLAGTTMHLRGSFQGTLPGGEADCKPFFDAASPRRVGKISATSEQHLDYLRRRPFPLGQELLAERAVG